jgi:hypothetical protein
VTINNVVLKLPDKFNYTPETPHFSTMNTNLVYLNLNNCGIKNKTNKLIFMFCLTCTGLKYLTLRYNKIDGLNNLQKVEGQEQVELKLLIDYRNNSIVKLLTSSTADALEECTLLLWNNPYEDYEDERMEGNPYHIYIPDDGADLYYNDILYSN